MQQEIHQEIEGRTSWEEIRLRFGNANDVLHEQACSWDGDGLWRQHDIAQSSKVTFDGQIPKAGIMHLTGQKRTILTCVLQYQEI